MTARSVPESRPSPHSFSLAGVGAAHLWNQTLFEEASRRLGGNCELGVVAQVEIADYDQH